MSFRLLTLLPWEELPACLFPAASIALSLTAGPALPPLLQTRSSPGLVSLHTQDLLKTDSVRKPGPRLQGSRQDR